MLGAAELPSVLRCCGREIQTAKNMRYAPIPSSQTALPLRVGAHPSSPGMFLCDMPLQTDTDDVEYKRRYSRNFFFNFFRFFRENFRLLKNKNEEPNARLSKYTKM